MAENEDQEEQLISSNRIVTTTISELPGKSYGITVEVPLFLTMLSVTLSGAALSNIILYRTCVHSLHHSEDDCKIFLSPHVSNTTKELEEEVQRYATFVSTVKTVIESVGPALVSFFLGVWSDTHGRKPLIVWPLLGVSLTAILTVVYGMMGNLGPWWFLLTAIPLSLTGGFTVLLTGSFCYLSDITTASNRSIRMTLLEAALSLGMALGTGTSTYLIRSIGDVYLLLISAALMVIAYAYANIRLKESLTGAVPGRLSSVLDFLLVKEMVRESFKKRPNNGRIQIILLTLANTFTIFIMYGLINLEYLYTRAKIHWSLKEFTIYSTSNTGITFFGAFLGLILLQKLLRMSDLVLAIIAFLSSGAEYLIKTFAMDTWHMYMGAGVSLFKGLASPLIRSLVTKILPVEDIAKVFSLMCAIEGLCPLVAPPMYNALYAYTISFFPGAIYVLSTGIAGIGVIMLGFVQFYRCRTPSSAYQLVGSQT